MNSYSRNWRHANIEEFEKAGVKKIVTIDPHAYNIFKNEYPDFGWKAEVLSPYRNAI